MRKSILWTIAVLTIWILMNAVGLAQPVVPGNVTLGKPAEASSFRGSYTPDLAVDGVWDTKESRWLSGVGQNPPYFLEIDLEGVFVITSAEVWTGDPTAGDPHAVDRYKLQYWTGTDWADIPGASVENNEDAVVYLSFSEPITTRRVRFYYDGQESVIRVREVIVYGIPESKAGGGSDEEPGYPDDSDPFNLSVVRDGKARGVVVIPNDASPQLAAAANTVVDYITKATGVRLRIMKEETYRVEAAYYRGFTALLIGERFDDYTYEDVVAEKLEGLDAQGFVIYPCIDSVRIAGPTVWGTLNGVYEFLERYVGVRWLVPGDVGEDVPTATDILIPREIVRLEPAFAYRRISDLSGGDPFLSATNRTENLWANRNKLQGSYNHNIEFHHNLGRLIASEVFGQSNPEFFPGGNPPAPGDIRKWQPCFTAEGIVEAAAARIIEFFDNNPQRMSYSLGVNDLAGYCEDNPSHPAYPGQKNSLGLTHMSEIYYRWVNEVVEKVTAVHPDKWFGLLAYQEVMDPPSFSLHPRVIPFITKDRMAWLDDEVRQENHDQMDAWSQVAHQIGWYDYMYGLSYYVPRVFPRLLGETMQYAVENKVFGLYTEMHTNIVDGPKPWLLSKLLWDPYADVDLLLQEWYERAVGPEAAPDLAAFYDLWEHFWTERILETPWFNNSKTRTYLAFSNPDYLSHVTEEDIDQSVTLLESAIEKAQTEKQRARAQLIRDAFEFHRISALSYPRRVQPPRDEVAALDYVERFSNDYAQRIQMAEERYELIDQLNEQDATLRIRSRNWWFWWTHWSGWNNFDLLVLQNYLMGHEPGGGPVTDRLTQLLESHEDHRRNFAYFVQMALGHYAEAPSITDNSSFELASGTSGLPTGWVLDFTGTGGVERTMERSHTGDNSLKLHRVQKATISQSFPRPDGLIAAQVHFMVPSGTSHGTIRMELVGRNDEGENLIRYQTPPVSLSVSNGTWHALTLLDVLPAKVNEKFVNPGGAEPPGFVIPITEGQIIVTVEGASSTDVYIDDLVIYRDVPLGAPIHYKELKPPSGPRNVALGSIVRESSYRGEYFGDRAVDGNWTARESRWLTGGGTAPPHWLEIDLTGVFTLDRAEVWTGDPSTSNPAASSTSQFKLQYWDGEEWSDIPGASVRNNRSDHVVFEFDEPITADRVRFYSEAIDDGVIRVREILLYERIPEGL